MGGEISPKMEFNPPTMKLRRVPDNWMDNLFLISGFQFINTKKFELRQMHQSSILKDKIYKSFVNFI